MSRYGFDSDYREGERDFERRGRRSYDRDPLPPYGSPDHDYMEGFRKAEREEERRQEERREREAEERREEERMRQHRLEAYWEEQRQEQEATEQEESEADNA